MGATLLKMVKREEIVLSGEVPSLAGGWLLNTTNNRIVEIRRIARCAALDSARAAARGYRPQLRAVPATRL